MIEKLTHPHALTAMVMLVCIAVLVFLRQRNAHKQAQLEKDKANAPYRYEPNGWVVVNERTLKPTPRRPIEDIHLAGLTMPPATDLVLCMLQSQDRYEMMFGAKHDKYMHNSNLADRRRGATIGSALFNYSIPESFVLLDHRTRLLYALYMRQHSDRRPLQEWLTNDREFFQRQFNLITAAERDVLKTSKDDVVAFYNRYYQVIAYHLVIQNAGEHAPSINGFVENVLIRLGESSKNDHAIHHLRICITIMTDIMELRIPKDWVMISEMAETVLDTVLDRLPEPTARPRLTLVSKS